MMTTNLTSEDLEAARTIRQIYNQALREKEEEEDHQASLALSEISQTQPKQDKKMRANKSQPEDVKKQRHKRKPVEEDDSEETLRIMLEWKPEKPPFLRELELEPVGVCSEPMRKQLTESDVKEDQCRLMLGKKHVKKILEVMGDSDGVGSDGLEVSVYGPNRDGEVYKMMFKMWNGDTPVLTSTAWKKFVRDYELKMHSDFLTIWMFKHKRDTRDICFAIGVTRFPNLEKSLSRRIIKAVFQDPN